MGLRNTKLWISDVFVSLFGSLYRTRTSQERWWPLRLSLPFLAPSSKEPLHWAESFVAPVGGLNLSCCAPFKFICEEL